MVVREGAIDLAVHRDDLAAHALEEFWRQFASDAVAAIHGDRHRAGEFDIAHDLVEIGGFDVGGFHRARLIRPVHITGFDALLQRLNSVTSQRVASDHHFETVVIRGVMTSRDGDAGIGL